MTKPLLKGVLKTWKEDRGFGFILPDNGGRDLFIHISALGQPSRRPIPGDIIHYQIARDKHGKLRAVNANIEGVSSQGSAHADSKGGSPWLKIGLGCLLLAIIGAAVLYYLQSQNML